MSIVLFVIAFAAAALLFVFLIAHIIIANEEICRVKDVLSRIRTENINLIQDSQELKDILLHAMPGVSPFGTVFDIAKQAAKRLAKTDAERSILTEIQSVEMGGKKTATINGRIWTRLPERTFKGVFAGKTSQRTLTRSKKNVA